MLKRRVVVTGLGLVTPIGVTKSDVLSALREGRSGVIRIPDGLFKTDDLPSQIAGLVSEEDVSRYLNVYFAKKNLSNTDRFVQLGVAAGIMAVEDAGLTQASSLNYLRIGVSMGSGIGGLKTIYDNSTRLNEVGPRRISPYFIPSVLVNMTAGHIANEYGYKGPNNAVATACATGAHAIIDAAKSIMLDEADVMIAGASEAPVCRLAVSGFCSLKSLSTKFNDKPEAASRPWSASRDGFVIAEGSATLVLEEYEHAKKRGANIYAEIAGFGTSCDAYHITAPSPEGEGGTIAMSRALTMAGITPEKVGYINAHATSTGLGDKAELIAIRGVFGEFIKTIPISSTKSFTGHTLGGAGAIEAAVTIASINDGFIHHSLNLEDADSDIVEGLFLPKDGPLPSRPKYALSNSFGFGGTNASIIFSFLN